MKKYQVSVKLNDATIKALKNYQLYGFLSMGVLDENALPVLWNSWKLAQNINVSWSNQYSVYTSSTPLKKNQVVSVGWDERMDTGQRLEVPESGVGELYNDGLSGKFVVKSKATKPFVCGFITDNNPFCASQVNKNQLQVFKPLPRVMLMFAPDKSYPLGSELSKWEKNGYDGLLIDMNEAHERLVSFDIKKDWQWGNYAWGEKIPVGENLKPYLVPQSEDLIRDSALLRQLLSQ